MGNDKHKQLREGTYFPQFPPSPSMAIGWVDAYCLPGSLHCKQVLNGSFFAPSFYSQLLPETRKLVAAAMQDIRRTVVFKAMTGRQHLRCFESHGGLEGLMQNLN